MNYLIWANSYLAVFYGFYWFFLRKETFFQLNRGYLLSSIFLSFILPLLDLKGYFFPVESTQFFYTLGFETQINQVVVPSVSAWSNWMDSIAGISIIVLIYGVGCVFVLIRLLYRLVLIKRNFKTFYPGQAYSFFNKVHIDPGLIGYTTIVEHENIHVKQFHSLDIILVELVKIINWFNPIVYLFHRSMKLNHEYIADNIAAQGNNDRTDYAQILMCQALDAPIHALANNFFNQSFTKKRIIMLFKNKSKKLVLSRFFLLIPVVLVFFAFQNKEEYSSRTDESDSSKAVGNLVAPVDLVNLSIKQTTQSALPASVPQSNKITEPVLSSVTEGIANMPSESRDLDTVVSINQEEAPVPPGGLSSFLRYIGTNYVYPKEAEEAKVKGRLILTFVVEKDGSISEVKSVQDLGHGTGEEAVRVLESSPKWTPGKKDGEAVRVQYTLPIVLNLDSDSPQE